MSQDKKHCVLEYGKSTCASDMSKCQTCTPTAEDLKAMKKEAKREFKRQVLAQRGNLERTVTGLECQLRSCTERNRLLMARLERFHYPHGRCRSSPNAPCGSGSWNTYPVSVDRMLGQYGQTITGLTNQVGKLRMVVTGLDEQMRLAGIKRAGCKKTCTYACKGAQCPPLGDCECETLAWSIIDAVKELNELMESCKLDKRIVDMKDLFKDLNTLQ